MRLQTSRKIEIVRLVSTGPKTYIEAWDPDDPTRAAAAINEGQDFAPDFEAKAGDLLLVKVLE